MVYIRLPHEEERRLSFYLAMEEYIAREVDVRDAFFIWQVLPSVIFGRNQLIESEVNIDYCRRNEVKMYRRKSGGGCVYADKSNMMLSFVTSSDHVCLTYNRYIMLVVDALHKIGVPATANGRNDVMIEGRKVSGNAFYHIPGRSIVHGTMLYDTNMRNMTACITPDDEKLLSKGVKSVRQHIALLKDYTTLTIDEVKKSIIESVCDSTMTLTDDDVAKIEEIEKEYLTDEFIYGNNPKYTVIRKQRIEKVGTVEVRMEVKNDTIRDIDLKGDFFLIGDIDTIRTPLKGVSLSRDAIIAALPENIGEIIMNLGRDDLAGVILRRKADER
ncbi:MAG: lipoate--protein ligase [Prevotella sp.]|uniref:lipoate--protein ligase n=1 Tax=Prevotella sp. TaxID=59823 RepID=UPI002A34CB1C|nr:lipoate--protein ligase [Prevotella sp.]MDD7318281.1 lipoate--protein ligase [Prevotellaceae bacterium]MDY4019715.1 lipoate--protein ligase [Prevotella sp.]